MIVVTWPLPAFTYEAGLSFVIHATSPQRILLVVMWGTAQARDAILHAPKVLHDQSTSRLSGVRSLERAPLSRLTHSRSGPRSDNPWEASQLDWFVFPWPKGNIKLEWCYRFQQSSSRWIWNCSVVWKTYRTIYCWWQFCQSLKHFYINSCCAHCVN